MSGPARRAAAAAKGATRALGPSAVPRPTLAALSTDVLSLVFGFTPLRARLLTLARVCKRWRAAAVRSVRHLELRGYGTSAEVLQSRIASFPCVTSLKLDCTSLLGTLILPVALTRLNVNLQYGPPASFLAAHFASLTHLTLQLDTSGNVRVAAFVKRHNASLRSFAIHIQSFQQKDASKIAHFLLDASADGLPALLTLRLPLTEPSAMQTLLSRASSLTSLTLFAPNLLDASNLPLATLGSCKNLHIRLPYTREEPENALAWARKLPNLRSLNCRSMDALNPTYYSLTRSEPWHTLAAFTALRSLNLSEWNGRVPTSAPPLARLKRVTIDGHNAFTQACGVLKLCHRLRYLSVPLRDRKPEEAKRQYDELCDLAIRSGLRTLVVSFAPEGYVPRAAKAGWLSVKEDFGRRYED